MPVIVEEREFYTRQEACAILGIKPTTLYAYVSRGVLSSYRQGIKRRRLYPKSQVDGLLLGLAPGGRAGMANGEEGATGREAADIPRAETWIGYT